jgi:hypothetical protein
MTDTDRLTLAIVCALAAIVYLYWRSSRMEAKARKWERFERAMDYPENADVMLAEIERMKAEADQITDHLMRRAMAASQLIH